MAILRRKEEEDKINFYIRNRIREVREQREMSQSDLAQYVYKTRAAVSDLERGRVRVNATDLALIAGALEKPIAYFFPPTWRGLRFGERELTPDEEEIIYLYRWLRDNSAMQKLAYERLKSMADAVREAMVEEIAQENESLIYEATNKDE